MAKILGLNTVTIAVEDIDAVRPVFEAILGMKAGPKKQFPEDFYEVAIFQLDQGPMIELLRPTGGQSPVQRLIAKKGPGFFHIGIEVDDLDGAIDELKAKGITVSSTRDYKDLIGWSSWREAFVSPKQTSGALIALVERRNGKLGLIQCDSPALVPTE